jgi:hypothetical protein
MTMAIFDAPVAGANNGTEQTNESPRRYARRSYIRYGLPCAGCGAYYSANVDACPVCNSTERVSPLAAAKFVRTETKPAAIVF